MAEDPEGMRRGPSRPPGRTFRGDRPPRPAIPQGAGNATALSQRLAVALFCPLGLVRCIPSGAALFTEPTATAALRAAVSPG